MTSPSIKCILVAAVVATAGLAVKPSAAADVRVFTSGAPATAYLKMLAGARDAWRAGGFEPLVEAR